MIFIGIDPGLDGGIALIKEGKDNEVLELKTFRMPTIKNPKNKTGKLYDIPEVNSIFKDCSNHSFATLEKINPMPKQGVTSMFSMGQGYGILLGLLTANNIPHQLIQPRVWQRSMFGSINKKNTKEASIHACKMNYPKINLIPDGCKKPHHGIADALLMAEYARRTYRGMQKGV